MSVVTITHCGVGVHGQVKDKSMVMGVCHHNDKYVVLDETNWKLFDECVRGGVDKDH